MTDEEILQRAEEIKAEQAAASETAAASEIVASETAAATDSPSPSAGPSASAVPAETESSDDAASRVTAGALAQGCNPFYGMTELDDRYLLCRIDMDADDTGGTTYRLKYIVEDSTLGFARNIAEVFQLENVDAEAVKKQIENGETVSFSVRIPSIGIQATAQMYADGNSDALSLQTAENGAGIGAFIDLNINRSIFSDAETQALFTSGFVADRTLSILIFDNFMYSKIAFAVGDNMEAYRQAYTSNVFLDAVGTDTFTQPEVAKKDGDTEITFSQNKLDCEIMLSDAGQTVIISQSADALDAYLSEYLEPEFHPGSLTALGFSIDEESGTMDFQDETAQVQISKTALGAEKDRISVRWENHPGYDLSIKYDVDTQSYKIWTQSEDGSVAADMIVEKDGRVKGTNPYRDYVWALDSIPSVTGMGVAETAEVLRREFDDYLSRTFGMTAGELFAAEVN